jgi:integrase
LVMAGTIREAKLGNSKARSRLKPGRQPHWHTIVAGRDHLGYQRKEGDAAGRWLLRRRRGGNYSTELIGIADDRADADGVSILDFQQARAKVVELSMDETRPAGRLTVQRAVADYIDYLSVSGKNIDTAESCAVTYILPKLGHCEVMSLTSPQLRQWVAWVAEMPPQGGNGILHYSGILHDEAIRRRRASANRILSVLKAALNHAFDEGRVPSNAAWGRRVKKYRGIASSRARYLTIEECRRFLHACDATTFRPLARAALETGMRYGELARLEVSDFNKAAGTILVRKSKTARQRYVILTPEGVLFFSDACAGRRPEEIMFLKPDGKRWTHGAQGRYVRMANERAGINPPITFHMLRHTWASLAVMGGVPLVVVAKNLGHVDTRMVERVYGHLAPSFVADAIRAGAPRFV